ncbi:MAG: polyprenyl synthetase family protein [Lachnospiraceae bacterium]|nr:polyprenyl synthetase family protein [Lachnospiraceae bacterium]
MEFKVLLSEKIKEAEEIIYDYLPEEEGKQALVMEAMNYSVRAGGKRLRPLFIMEFSRLFGGNIDEAKPFMAAMECIHTYSLVHDDLPEMDNDELRRGMPTTHIKYGQAMAVLAGDGLLNYAYEIVAGAIINSSSPYKSAIAFDILSRYAGIYGMIGGQTVDVMSVNGINDKETLDFIYELKTGALIKASMMIGALLGGADEEQLLVVESIADKVGMAFQIQDDILDVTSSTDELGKPVLSDDKNNKFTYVSLLGLEDAGEYVSVLSEAAIKDLRELGMESEFLEELINYLINRKN